MPNTNRPSGWGFVSVATGVYGTGALATNTWTHLATTFDGTTLRLFVNGVQTATQALSGNLRVSTGALRIGGNAVWGEYFRGMIDEVRIYNRALDALAIQSDMSTPVDVFGPDTTPPQAPGTPTAFAPLSNRVDLSWGVAVDNVGVASYRIERCTGANCSTFAQLATTAVTTYVDTTVAATTTYVYRVRAVDPAGNLGPYSATVSVTTPVVGGGVIQGLSARWRCNLSGCTDADWVAAAINWPSSSAYSTNARSGSNSRTVLLGHGGAQYPYMGPWATGCQVTAVSNQVLIIEWKRGTDIWRETLLNAGQSHTISLVGNEDNAMIETPNGVTTLSVVLSNCNPQPLSDTVAPTAPGTLSGTAPGNTQVNLTWGAATDNIAVTGYRVERCAGASCTTFAQSPRLTAPRSAIRRLSARQPTATESSPWMRLGTWARTRTSPMSPRRRRRTPRHRARPGR